MAWNSSIHVGVRTWSYGATHVSRLGISWRRQKSYFLLILQKTRVARKIIGHDYIGSCGQWHNLFHSRHCIIGPHFIGVNKSAFSIRCSLHRTALRIHQNKYVCRLNQADHCPSPDELLYGYQWLFPLCSNIRPSRSNFVVKFPNYLVCIVSLTFIF